MKVVSLALSWLFESVSVVERGGQLSRENLGCAGVRVGG